MISDLNVRSSVTEDLSLARMSEVSRSFQKTFEILKCGQLGSTHTVHVGHSRKPNAGCIVNRVAHVFNQFLCFALRISWRDNSLAAARKTSFPI